ncbi:transcriptional regulator [Microbacterium sorbitolivorans]|uniref:TetR/AcrR family transcriptional regulator n=1 Tax=Microbacterium sorbitolivorans TaxID=1867410 RepID=A0A367Y0I9_9MICO|nr:TetR/AcrR family transcriptional regulator [Microbacterium sorbitolivorans]RCK58541.1 TetR/AcrR family transcriptional regulator [Microbacterium sorbitolivorans]GGF37377.1 transcriptional regulator [Microbacterium sorbitolivorans]
MNESQVSPKVRGREATRAKLLDAAGEVFAEVGLGEASVERICERAGFTRGAFYSNFASKDEMFIELATLVARERVDAVRSRIDEIAIDCDATDVTVIIRALDVFGDDRASAMLMSEITIHAMRDADFAAAYSVQIDAVTAEVVQLIDEIVEAKGLRLKLPADDAARIIVGVWSDSSVRAAIANLEPEQLAAQRTRELSQIVDLLIVR